MADYWPAITTTVVLTGIFTYFLVQSDFDAIRSDWENRRCEFPVMVMAALLKPSDSSLSPMEFAQQNFSFCTQKNIQSVLQAAVAPFYSVLGQQVGTLDTMGGPLNSIRGMLRNSVQVFGKFMDKQYRQFSAINAQILKIWQHLLFSVGRIQGIAYSLVYLGLSLSAFIENTIKFTFHAILVFLGIIVALIILLWFVLFPVIPLILTVIAVMTAAGVGAAAGMAGAFCIDPEATIVLQSGERKRLKEIQLSDHLRSRSGKSNVVTGILEVESLDTPLVKIDGVLMSGSHRVLWQENWILAEEHPQAQPVSERLPFLICLNTSQHEVELTPSLVVSDWEEVTDEEGRQDWIDAVNVHLNGKDSIAQAPTAVPLVSPATQVWKEGRGKVPIKAIQVGDAIQTRAGITRVKGIYRGHLSITEQPKNPEWISDGVWIQDSQGHWGTAAEVGIAHQEEGSWIQEGLFLVTEAEEFLLEHDGKTLLVRDFTEIGASQIDKTYDRLERQVNKKSSP